VGDDLSRVFSNLDGHDDTALSSVLDEGRHQVTERLPSTTSSHGG
jgi:hypothetical protein